MTTAQTILNQQPGPLPITCQYTPESDEPVTLIFSGSVYTGNIDETIIGFDVKVNGETIGASTIASRSTSQYHFATVPGMVTTKLPFVERDGKIQPVTFELVANCDTLSGKTDYFSLCVIN